MVRYLVRRGLARYGLVRLVGGRAIPVLLAWDLVVLANRTRKVPIVERTMRRGANALSRRVVEVTSTRRRPLQAGAAGRRPWRRGDVVD